MRAFVVLLAVSSMSEAASPDKRVAALIIPMDKKVEPLTLRIESSINDALRELEGVSLKTSDDLFGVAQDEGSAAALKRADRSFLEGKALYENRDYEKAEKKLRTSMKEYEHATGAMKDCGNLCEAVVMYASALYASGDTEGAKAALLDFLALAPGSELDRERYPPSFVALKAQVATSPDAQLRGNIDVKTRPSGARVYLDGSFRGYSPCTLPALPIGKHLVHVERPGFRQFGRLVTVTPAEQENQKVDAELKATSDYKAFDRLLAKLASEALKNAPKDEALKDEAPKNEAPKNEAPDDGAPDDGAPKSKTPKRKAPKRASKTKAPEANAPETDALETDAPETDAPETDDPKRKASKTKAPKTDGPETDGPKSKAQKSKDPGSKGRSVMGNVGSSLKLDRALIGVVRKTGTKTELVLGYFDLKEGRRSSTKRASFEGDELGEFGGEIGAMVRSLLDSDVLLGSLGGADGTEKPSGAGDAVAGRQPTEDANAEDKDNQKKAKDRKNTKKKNKKKGGDPADSVSGTELPKAGEHPVE